MSADLDTKLQHLTDEFLTLMECMEEFGVKFKELRELIRTEETHKDVESVVLAAEAKRTPRISRKDHMKLTLKFITEHPWSTAAQYADSVANFPDQEWVTARNRFHKDMPFLLAKNKVVVRTRQYADGAQEYKAVT